MQTSSRFQRYLLPGFAFKAVVIGGGSGRHLRSPKTRRPEGVPLAELLATADESMAKLNRLVENLLDLSRLEAGVLPLNLRVTSLEEVLPTALADVPDVHVADLAASHVAAAAGTNVTRPLSTLFPSEVVQKGSSAARSPRSNVFCFGATVGSQHSSYRGA